MKRTELCNIAGCGGRRGTTGKCNHKFTGDKCPKCEYELIKNEMSGAIFCKNCGHADHGNSPLGKMLKNIGF